MSRGQFSISLDVCLPLHPCCIFLEEESNATGYFIAAEVAVPANNAFVSLKPVLQQNLLSCPWFQGELIELAECNNRYDFHSWNLFAFIILLSCEQLLLSVEESTQQHVCFLCCFYSLPLWRILGLALLVYIFCGQPQMRVMGVSR